MSRVSLGRIASARSGDKGEGSNVGVIARSSAAYAFLKEHFTDNPRYADFIGGEGEDQFSTYLN